MILSGMSILINRIKRDSTLSAAIIFALAITAAYSPIIFLNQSYNQSTPIPPEFLGYQGKSTIFGITMDKWANSSGIPPIVKLGVELFSEGKLPLWNPYIGVGQPLAADSTYHLFSPLIFGFFLPVEFWDIPLLIALWIAGIFTFLFLRNLGLGFIAATAGGIFYVLSGGFTWYLTNPNMMVMTFTPFILYSLEKIFQNNNPKYIIFTSIAFSFAILGAHLETIVLQLLFVGLYVGYRIIYTSISDHGIIQVQTQNRIVLGAKRMLSWSVLGLIGGLGLSAFFIFPVYEFIENGILEHDETTGVMASNPIGLLSAFVPYILGPMHGYWTQDITGIGLWGYVGIFALFFSIVGVWLSTKNNSIHKYTPVFFLAVSVFFIMKVVGVPVVNWIGYLPILNLLTYGNYTAVIIPFGFAVAAAFGIDSLHKIKVSKEILGTICIITIAIILLLLIPILPSLSPDANFPPHVSPTDARNYVGFQILQAVIFAAIALLAAIAISKNRQVLFVLIPLVLLELSLYIPVGLHPIWMSYKAIVIILTMAVITALIIKPNRLAWNLETSTVKLPVIVGITMVAFASVVLVSEFSPYGMMQRYDSFQDNPVTDFFKANLGYQRMFSFDFTMGPNYPTAYKISTIGQFAAFHINSFYSFNRDILEQKSDSGRLGFFPWIYSYGPMESMEKFFEHKKYFDFLGVKYILTQGYDFNTFAPGIPGQSGQFVKIQDSVSQSFISPVDSIKSIGISLGAVQRQNNVTLTIDSVSKDEKYHRESTVHTISNQQLNQFEIIPPLTDLKDKKLYMTLKHNQIENENFVIVFTYSKNQTGYDLVADKLQGRFYENGNVVEGKQMAFSVTSYSEKHPPAFRFHDINIHENANVFPRAFLASRYITVDEGKAQEYLKENPDFDLRNTVILERELPAEESSLLESPAGSAEILSLDANKVTIKTDSDVASLLVLTDVYYPRWKAFVDGKETEIYRADGLVRAVFVPAGSHIIEFSYMPESFIIGLLVSFITAAFLFFIFIHSKLQEKTITKY